MDEEWVDIASSVERQLSSILFQPPGDNHAYLAIEGDTDYTLFTNLSVKPEYIINLGQFVDTPCGKKDKVIELITKANSEGFTGIIGIVDADFDHIKGYDSINNLYMTDFHDLETMLIYSITAFKRIVRSFLKEQESCDTGLTREDLSDEYIKDIQLSLLDSSKYVGCALYCSNEYGWMINFKNFPIDVCLNEDFSLDFDKMIKCLTRRVSSGHSVPEEIIKQEINKILGENFNLWQLCRGKELFRVFSKYIKKCDDIRSINYNAATMRMFFLHSFNKDDFALTQLYKSIKQWENRTNYCLIDF